MDFEQDIMLNVRQFNMQTQQFAIAAKADTIAQKRYDVCKTTLPDRQDHSNGYEQCSA